MEKNLNNRVSEIKKVQFVNRWWYKFVVCLSACAVFVVTYFLMLPAMTASVYGTEVISGNIVADKIYANNVYPIDAILGPEAGYTTAGNQTAGLYSDRTNAIIANSNVIMVKLGTASQNLRYYFYGKGNAAEGVDGTTSPKFGINLGDWVGIRITYSTDYNRYFVRHMRSAALNVGNMQTGEKSGKDFILLIRKTFISNGNNGALMYLPDACDGKADGMFDCNKSGSTDVYTYTTEKDIYAHVNMAPLANYDGTTDFYSIAGHRPRGEDVVANKFSTDFGYVTLSPYIAQTDVSNAGPLDGDVPDSALADNITFKLFDYTEQINKRTSGWSLFNPKRTVENDCVPIAKYFSFRNTNYLDVQFTSYWGKYGACTCGGTSASDCKGASKYKSILHRNDTYDEDGFTINHATAYFRLNSSGFPIIDLRHDAKGNLVSGAPSTSTVTATTRSLGYLFSSAQAKQYVEEGKLSSAAVKAYDPVNTILQYDSNTSTYWYDSALNAVDYNTSTNRFYVRGYTERNDDSARIAADMTNYSDFLPFNYGRGIVTETYSVYNSAYKSSLRDSAFNRYNYISRNWTNVNYWFGMTMEFTFIQGKDGTITYVDSEGKKHTDVMEFSFSGDDDVWVFIDGVKVLDLGGTHGAATGSINFQTGEIKQYLSWNGATEDNEATSFPTTLRTCFEKAYSVEDVEWNAAGTTFADYTAHTLKFFYLERGACVANCSIRFNLQSFGDRALIVEKKLENATTDTDEHADEVLEYLQETKEYKFRVLGSDKSTLLFEEGEQFKIFDKETGMTTTATIGANGIFTLKHNEQAIFENIWDRTGSTEENIVSYYVQELLPDGQVGQYDGVQYTLDHVTGTDASGDADVQIENFTGYLSPDLQPTESHTITFTNTVKIDALYDLTINKTLELVEGAPSGLENNIFDVQVTLDGTLLPVGTVYIVKNKTTNEETTRTVQTEGIVEISPDETVVIKGILDGTTYVVKEMFDSEEKGYVIKYDGVVSSTGTTGSMTTDQTIAITNSQSGANIQIPISKTLLNAVNDSSFTFNFSLIEVTKDSGGVFVDSSEAIDSITLTLNSASAGDDTFSLQYLANQFTAGDTYLYYKIVETTNDSDKVSIIDYDTAAYIVTVKISKDEIGIISSSIEDIMKYDDGDITSAGTSATSVAFVNTLNLYSLPATGGDSNIFESSLFTVGNILVICAIAGFALCISARKKKTS